MMRMMDDEDVEEEEDDDEWCPGWYSDVLLVQI